MQIDRPCHTDIQTDRARRLHRQIDRVDRRTLRQPDSADTKTVQILRYTDRCHTDRQTVHTDCADIDRQCGQTVQTLRLCRRIDRPCHKARAALRQTVQTDIQTVHVDRRYRPCRQTYKQTTKTDTTNRADRHANRPCRLTLQTVQTDIQTDHVDRHYKPCRQTYKQTM